MKSTSSRFLATVSAALLAAAAAFHGAASERPRYGGTLRVQMEARLAALDPSAWPADPARAAAAARLVPLVFETLVTLDEQGRPQPGLALAWNHDAERTHWQFRLRRGVEFHDGAPLGPTAVVAALESAARPEAAEWRVTAFGETVVIQSARPMPHLLAELAHPRRAIFRRARPPQAGLLGTGPFQIAEWTPEQRARLVAFENHRRGRPYLDAVEIEMGRAPRQQYIDFELGRADLVEVAPGEARRLSEAGRRVWSSPPVELLAVVFTARETAEDARLRQALALSLDRASLHTVLLAGQGEPSAAALPQWLTGHAFLFPAERDLERAGALRAELPGRLPPLALVYDSGDALAQAVAERVAVNARDAGLTVQPTGRDATAAGQAGARLVRWRLSSPDPAKALADFAVWLGREAPTAAADLPEALYAAERSLLEDSRILPLAHLPETLGLGARVRNWAPRGGGWPLAGVWLAREPRETAGREDAARR